MEPGFYVLCRKISGGPAAHQFLVLVPREPKTLQHAAQTVNNVRCVVLGAYDIQGFLRARLFAESDVAFFAAHLTDGRNSGVQLDKVKLQACLAGPEDGFLELVYRSYVNYRSHEGGSSEIRYPSGSSVVSTIMRQLDPRTFNSNSWAQSMIFWSSLALAPSIAIQDFEGLDVGNDRIIPRLYFQPRG